LASDLNEALDNEDFLNTADSINLMELLIYLFPIWGEWIFDLPAFNTFTKFADFKPDIALTLLRKHTQISHPEIRAQVWRMLTYIDKAEEIPAELVEEACHLLLEFDKNDLHKSVSLVKEVVRFLEKCATERNLSYPSPVVEQMERYYFLPYLSEQTNDTGT
jgi:hypothetical protein